jgi:hypothetical protein
MAVEHVHAALGIPYLHLALESTIQGTTVSFSGLLLVNHSSSFMTIASLCPLTMLVEYHCIPLCAASAQLAHWCLACGLSMLVPYHQ